MKRLGASVLIIAAIFIGFTIASVGGQQAQPAAGSVFTAAQAQAGEAAYAQQCAACHGADFRGGGDAPPVAGVDFRTKWGPRAINELFTYIVQTMPPTSPGVLGEQGMLNVTAYLLQINGASAGAQPLTPRVETPVNAVAQGGAAPAPARGGGGRGAMPPVLGAGTAARGRGGEAAPRGVTVPGEVKNYVPVTDAMLRNPPPGDWLWPRTTRDRYSPLIRLRRPT